jgi:uncharacterized membrane protein YbhN (UPF0104 family)
MLVGANGRWLLVGLGFYLLTNAWRAYRFGALMNIKGSLAPLHLLPDMVLLSFLNNVLPARSGELSFPYIMHKRHDTPVGETLTFLLIVRIFDLLTIVTLFLVFAGVAQAQLTGTTDLDTGRMLRAVFIFLLPVLLFMAFLPWLGKYGYQLLGWMLHRLGMTEGRLGSWLLTVGEKAVEAMGRVHNRTVYSRVFFWSILGWLTTFAWFAAFMQAIGTPLRYPLVVVGASFATVSKAIPFMTVGGFGAHEAGWSFGFYLVGLPLEQAIASGFAVNILTLLASVLVGGVVLVFLKREWFWGVG